MSIRCADDDNHVAVLYCPKCEITQCKICFDTLHSGVLSKHEPVLLTRKPETPIYCHVHPQKTAGLVCKETSCEGINKPMCTICHQYGTHKDHEYVLAEIKINDSYIESCIDSVQKIHEIQKKLGISRNSHLQNQQEKPTEKPTLAVYFHMMCLFPLLESRKTSKVQRKWNGTLYKYEDGQSIIHLSRLPNDNTIDLSQYKYTFVIWSWLGTEDDVKNALKEQMKNNWWSKILFFIYVDDWENKESFVNEVQEIAKSDKRVEVMSCDERKEILDNILES